MVSLALQEDWKHGDAVSAALCNVKALKFILHILLMYVLNIYMFEVRFVPVFPVFKLNQTK